MVSTGGGRRRFVPSEVHGVEEDRLKREIDLLQAPNDLLEKQQLARQVLATINADLTQQGLMFKTGSHPHRHEPMRHSHAQCPMPITRTTTDPLRVDAPGCTSPEAIGTH